CNTCPEGESHELCPASVNPHGLGSNFIFAHIIPAPAYPRPLKADKDKHGYRNKGPNQVIEVYRALDGVTEDPELIQHNDAVGTSCQSPRVIEQSNTHYLIKTDCDYEQIISTEMENRPGK